MPDQPKPHDLQEDPPEGDPAVIDRELARQDEKQKAGGTPRPADDQPKAR